MGRSPTAAAAPKAAAKAPAKAPGEYGATRTHDVPWNDKKVAVFKALKALRYLGGARLVIGHSLVELVDTLVTDHAALRELRPAAQQLDQYYIPTRYPNGLPGSTPAEVFTRRQAEEAVAGAEAFIAAARAALSRPA